METHKNIQNIQSQTNNLLDKSFANLHALGTVSDLINYLNSNRKIFEKQRKQNEHMERVMNMLSHQNMQILQKQFQLYPKGLQLPTFIYLMKKLYQAQNQISQYYFVSDLIKFFQAIDINGDGHLQWSQFTQYIIENIRRVQKPKYKNKTFEENQIISSAYSKISNQYKITKVVDAACNNLVKKIVYVSKMEEYYLLESNTNVIKIFNKNFVYLDQFSINSIESSNAQILDFSFDKQNQIFGCIFVNSMRFCNMKVKTVMKFINECDSGNLKQYHKMQFLPLHQVWCYVSKNGQIKLSKVHYKSRIQIDFQILATFKQHQSMITQIVEIEDPKYICTSSMDGNIKMYSVQLKKTLQFQHISDQTKSIINSKFRKGVLGIDYTRQFGSYILSYGFSTAIYIYSLDISMTKGYTGNYNEHSGSLVAAKFLKSFPYILSFDDKLNLRIWDYRKFLTIQIINCEKNFINPSRLQIIPQLSECLICEKKITQFRAPALDKKSKEINQFHQIFDFKLDTLTNSIFLFSSNDVRVYDFLTGSLKRIFTKLNENRFQTNITAAQFGHKARRFFVGDAAGFVRQFCSQSGQFIQQIKPNQDIVYQNKQIVKILFLREHSVLICCSLDGRVLIYQRNQEGQYQMIRDIRQSHQQITCAGASSRYCLLATGGEDGSVNLWSLQKFNIQAALNVSSKVLSVCFSPIHPVLFVSQQKGTINIFYVKPGEKYQKRNNCICTLNYGSSLSFFNIQLLTKNYIPKQSCFKNSNNKFSSYHYKMIAIIGTKKGQIQLIDINDVMGELNVQENHQLFSINKSIRSEIQNLKSLLQTGRKKILHNSNIKPLEVDLKDDVYQKQIFEAHNDNILNAHLVKENEIIMTTSPDKKLKLWRISGQLYGTINFKTFKKINWKIPELNFYKKLQEIQTTLYSVRLIENKKISCQKQQFIKVTLLLKQYMNQEQKNQYLSWIKQELQQSQSEQFDSQDDQQIIALKIKQRQILKQKQRKKLKKKKNDQQESISPAQFNQIYQKIRNNIGQQLVSFDNVLSLKSMELSNQKKNSTKIGILKQKSNKGENLGISKSVQKGKKVRNSPMIKITQKQNQQRNYKQLFGKQMQKNQKAKPKAKNMLSCTLIDVKRNLEVMQRLRQKKR